MSEPTPPAEPTPTFDALFAAEYPKMVALAAAVSGSRLFAEDMAQEALHRLERNWPKVSRLESPGGWVRRVTINLALSQRRRFTNDVKARTRLGRPTHQLNPMPAELHAPIWHAVGALPGKQRAAVALRYLEDRSIDEIAQILDIAPATARVHLHRAHNALRESLPDFGPTDPPGSEQRRPHD